MKRVNILERTGTLFIQSRGSQPFQACRVPINEQTQGPWPTDSTTSSMRQLLQMHRAETTCATINAKAKPVVRKHRYSRLNT